MELIRRPTRRATPRLAVFDFDGTLSLIRGGWIQVMTAMIAETLTPLPHTTESPAELATVIRSAMLARAGQPTIFQMRWFVEEAQRRGGLVIDPGAALAEYHRRMAPFVAQRREQLATGRVSAEELLVPGSRALLDALQHAGVELILASGTELVDLCQEASLLGLSEFFGDRIYGPAETPEAFSKRGVMEAALHRTRSDPAGLLVLGDGHVEIAEGCQLGAITVGVASDEQARSGTVIDWKRDGLIAAGAHAIVADFRQPKPLLDWFFAPVVA